MRGTASRWADFEWSPPRDGRPGSWMPPVKPAFGPDHHLGDSTGDTGYFYCEQLVDLLEHIGPDLYEIEVRGEIVQVGGEAAAEQARLVRRVPGWNAQTCRLFAIDCARLGLKYAGSGNVELLAACLDVAAAAALYGGDWRPALDASHRAAEGEMAKAFADRLQVVPVFREPTTAGGNARFALLEDIAQEPITVNGRPVRPVLNRLELGINPLGFRYEKASAAAGFEMA